MRCKKCGGNIFSDYDNELTCLQCGAEYTKPTPKEHEYKRPPPVKWQSKYAWDIRQKASFNQTWLPHYQIRFYMDDILFLLSHLNLLRKGVYPPDPRESGYTSAPGIMKSRNRHAPFEIPVQIAGEIDRRLSRTGMDRYLVEDYFYQSETINSLALKLDMEEFEVEKRIRAVVTYIASGPCPRWINCIDCEKYRNCDHKKHAGISYRDWRKRRQRYFKDNMRGSKGMETVYKKA